MCVDTAFVEGATQSPKQVEMECTQRNYVDAVVSSMCPPIQSGKLCSTVKFSASTVLPKQSACEAWATDRAKETGNMESIQQELYQNFLDKVKLDRCGAHIYDSMARNCVYELRGLAPEDVVSWQTQGKLCRGNLDAVGRAACKMHNVDPSDVVGRHVDSSLTDEDFNGVCLTALRMCGAGAVVYATDTDVVGRSSERFTSMINTVRAIGDSGMSNNMSIVGDCEDSAIFNACAHNSFRNLEPSSSNPSIADAIAHRCRCQKAAIVTSAVNMKSASSARASELMTHTTCLVGDNAAWEAMTRREMPTSAPGNVYLAEGTGMVVTGLDGELAPAPAPSGSKLQMASQLQQADQCDLAGAMDIDAIDFYAYANTLVLDGTLYDVCTLDSDGKVIKGAKFSSLLKNDPTVCLRKSRNWSTEKCAALSQSARRTLVCESPQLEMRPTSTHACVYSASNSQPAPLHTFDQIARGAPCSLKQNAASCGAALQEIPIGMGAKLFMF
jgi:hypothetical protein